MVQGRIILNLPIGKICGFSRLAFSRVGSWRETAFAAPLLPAEAAALRGKLLLVASVQGRSAGPEAGRGVPTPPTQPRDATHPATGQGLHALDKPKEEVEAQKS